MTGGATAPAVLSIRTAGGRSSWRWAEYREGAHQPIWFSEPYFFCDTNMVGVFPHYKKWLSMYASLTDRDGERIFWYVDRKMFALGRYITDEMLAGLTVPE